MLRTLIAGLRERFRSLRPAAAKEPGSQPSVITRRGLFVVGALAATGVLLVGHSVHASNISDLIAKFVGYLAEIAIDLVGQLLLIMINALIWVAQYNGFVNSVPVVQGWSIVRDVTNMVFIVVMLIFAFGTILGVDSYSYKNKNLSGLLIMAVVVNFSRTICGLLIDASQVVMLTFVYGFKEAAGGNFADALGITQLMQMQEDGGGDLNVWSIAIALMLGVVLVTISLVVVTIMTVSLAIRIVYLWLLVVLSPLAFLARAVPGGSAKGNYGTWWKMFNAQLLFGPLLAFFLWLSLVSVSSADFISTKSGFAEMTTTTEAVNGGASKAFEGANIQKFIIAICMLLGGLKMSNQIADNFSAATSAGGKIAGAGKKAVSAVRGAYGGGRKLLSGTASAADRAGGLALSGANLVTGGRAEQGKNWALTKVAKAPLIGSLAEAKMARDKERNSKVAKAAAGRASTANDEIVTSRAHEMAFTQDGKIARNEFQKKRVEALGKKASKGKLSDEERAEYFGLAKNIRAHADAFKDDSGKKMLEDIEKKNIGLIVNKDEKDPGERIRMFEDFEKAAANASAQQIVDMGKGGLTQPFMKKAKAKQLLKAMEMATGENADILNNMGFTDAEIEADSVLSNAKKNGWTENDINYAKTKMEANAGTFSYGNEAERVKRVNRLDDKELKALVNSNSVQGADLGGAVLQNLVDSGRAGIVADKVAPTLSAGQLQGDGAALAQQIAAGISASALKALPDEIASVLRPLKAQVDKLGALQGGASMAETFTGFQDGKGFKNETSVRDFGSFLNSTAKGGSAKYGEAVGSIPTSALAMDGGVNDVSLSVINNMDVKAMETMTKGGGGANASQLMSTVDALSKVNPNDKEAVRGIVEKNPNLRMSESQIRDIVTKSGKLMAEYNGTRFTPHAAASKEAAQQAAAAAKKADSAAGKANQSAKFNAMQAKMERRKKKSGRS